MILLWIFHELQFYYILYMLLKILHEGLEIITEQKSVFDFLKIAWLAHNRVKRNTYCFRKNE